MNVVRDMEKRWQDYVRDIEEFKKSIMIELTTLKSDTADSLVTIRSPMNELQVRLKNVETKIDTLYKDSKTMSLDNDHLVWRIEQLDNEISKVKMAKMDTAVFQQHIDFVENELKTHQIVVEDTKSTLKEATDFTLRYTKLVVRNKMNEILNGVLRPLQLRDLLAYNQQTEKFNELLPEQQEMLNEKRKTLEGRKALACEVDSD